jgi:hypothetical protein
MVVAMMTIAMVNDMVTVHGDAIITSTAPLTPALKAMVQRVEQLLQGVRACMQQRFERAPVEST